jgi:hypothetical protein
MMSNFKLERAEVHELEASWHWKTHCSQLLKP